MLSALTILLSMSPIEDIRGYLSRRIAFLITDIDKCYSEIDYLTDLLRNLHTADIDTVPPINRAQPPAPPPVPIVRPPPLRPRLNPSKSTPDIKLRPEPPPEPHPAFRPAVTSQSRYPEFFRGPT
jgi:hypothetical protein